MRTLLTYFISLLLLAGTAQAQTTVQIGTGTLVPASTLYGPIYRASSTSSTDGARVNMLWTAAEMTAAGIPTGALITGVEFNKTNNSTFTSTFPFQMLVGNTANTTLTTSVTWAGILSTHTQVLSNPGFNIPAPAGWVPFTFSTPFTYTGGAFEVATEHDVSALPSPQSTDKVTWEYTDGHETKIAGITNPTGPTLSGTVAAYKERPNIRITYTVVTPCTTPPTPGTATASVSTVCPNVNFTLNLTGNTIGVGQSYQWQSSPNGSAPWSPLGTASTTSIAFSTTQTDTTYYRVAVTCSGQTAFSTPVRVNTNGNPLGGTYTINQNSGITSTNYTSFAALISDLICRGINAPITVNVAAGSGPYNEQVTIPAITGASATNTITFNGNGNTISFATTSAARAVVRLDEADHITLNNFVINASGTTHGWGIHLLNGADNNAITGNTINITSTSNTESNSVGIVFSNSTTSVIAAGYTGNNAIISGNTINGGYKAIHLNGEVIGPGNNQIINNTLKDFYSYGMEIFACKATVIQGNDISRPLRASTGTFYGIYLSGGTFATQVSKNRIHNTNDTDLTGTVYGLYVIDSDATAGSENVFSNNLLYNLNTTGIIYAIYNSSSDGAYYFHNTVSINKPNNTGSNRGFWQTGDANNIKFQNNIISINSGATGNKHAIYLSSSSSTIISNNNVLHVVGGASTSGIGFFSANQATLIDWQAVNSNAYDQNSIVADPQFANAATGDLTPTNTLVNNIGQAVVPAITTDITGNTRNPNAPDPGAYEFMNNTLDVGVTAITSPNSGCSLTGTETITIEVTNFNTNPQTSIPVSYTINAGAAVNSTIAGPVAPGATVSFSFPVPANLGATGNYTIQACTNLTGDLIASNNCTSILVTNSSFASLPITIDFETATTGVSHLRKVTNSRSMLTEDAGAAVASTKGLIMEGVDHQSWAVPTGSNTPWMVNPEHFSAVYFCFNPAGGNPNDPLWLTLDLKQLFKGINSSTSFRVTVNGNQVGPTYNPPFSGTPIEWRKVNVDLAPYKNLTNIEIGLESAVKEGYQSGAGTANLIDNVRVVRLDPTGIKDNLLQSQLHVFPNPSLGIFQVELPLGNTYELTVTDLSGRIIKKQTATGGLQKLKLNQASKGVYLLHIKGQIGAATRKLIVE